MKKGDSRLENTLLVSGTSWIWIHVKNIRLMKTGIFFFFCLSCVLWTLLHLEKCLAHSRCFTNACLQNLCPQLLTPWFPPWFLFLSLGALRFLLLSACPVVAPSSSLEPQLQKIPCFLNSIFSFFSPYPSTLSIHFCHVWKPAFRIGSLFNYPRFSCSSKIQGDRHLSFSSCLPFLRCVYLRCWGAI